MFFFRWKEMPTKRGSFETEADAASTARTARTSRRPKVPVTPSRRTVKPKPRRVEPIPVKPVVKPLWTRWTISPHGMKLVKVCEISQVVRFCCLTFWTSIMWTLIFIPFRDSTSLRHLEVCVFVVFLKSFLAFLVFYSVFCGAMSLCWGKASVQSNLVLKCWKTSGGKRSKGTSRLNCVAPSASFGPLWPVWSFVIFLGFCGGKAESWQPKASLFTMSKDAESQISRFHSSVFDEFHDFHGHQGSDRSDLPNMKSWPLETPAAFGNTQRRKHRQKHIQEMQLHTAGISWGFGCDGL